MNALIFSPEIYFGSLLLISATQSLSVSCGGWPIATEPGLVISVTVPICSGPPVRVGFWAVSGISGQSKTQHIVKKRRKIGPKCVQNDHKCAPRYTDNFFVVFSFISVKEVKAAGCRTDKLV